MVNLLFETCLPGSADSGARTPKSTDAAQVLQPMAGTHLREPVYLSPCPESHSRVMTVIKQDHLIESVAEALQYISYYHPRDYLQHLARAYEREQSPAAKDAIAQILTNSRMCAEGRRPICQDTGIVNVFLKIGMGVRFEGFSGSRFPSVADAVNEGVRRAYLDPDNPLRASVLEDPQFARRNTRDNTPAVVSMEIVPGETLQADVAAKGGGSEAKSKFAMLNPSDSVVEWVLKTVPTMGAGWCPPGLLGIGIGGTAEKAMAMAKEVLMEPIDMSELLARGPRDKYEELRLELYEKVNQLGIGAQGLGGLSTVLDVKIRTWPTHAANKPIAMIPNCAATRHVHFTLDGFGPAQFEPPSLDDWPKVAWTPSAQSRRVNLDTLTREEAARWKPGETLLLSGRLLTGRDAAHKRIEDMLARGEQLPVDFANRVIYYVGPVDPVRDEVVGPAGPTTATRMDKFTEMMLGRTGLAAMIGKGERGPAAIEAIRKHRAASLIAVGGAAYLVARAIRRSRILAFEDLGMEAIYEFEVKDMPVTVAVDASGASVHQSGPADWAKRIRDFKIPVSAA
jgi:fumarate hydratase, class I